MSLSRRAFVRSLGLGKADASSSGAWIAARGREALVAEFGPTAAHEAALLPPEGDEIRISSNENPLGPGAAALKAIQDGFGDAGRYPTNAIPTMSDLAGVIAKTYGAKPDNVVLGTGSGEVLRNSARAFTSAERRMVTADPSYLQAAEMARYLGHPVESVPLDAQLKLDLNGIAAKAKGAGLIFLCNPNNPSATVQSASTVTDFVREVRRSSPDTYILIDEAYHDYVTDPAHKTAIPLALETPRVFVARTFSKAYGMAGLRIGYAVGQPDTIAVLRKWAHVFNTNNLGNAAAYASIQDPEHIAQERARNKAARDFTLKFFSDAGFEASDSQTNFIFVNVRRPAKEFRDACREHNVYVGRDFPPMEKTHARISIGTMDEMQRATQVFQQVLGLTPTSAARG